MSRSYRHTPIFSWTGSNRGSEKYDKRTANRALRRRNRALLATTDLLEVDAVMFELREVSDRWVFFKDFRIWYRRRGENEPNAEFANKWLEKLMRK